MMAFNFKGYCLCSVLAFYKFVIYSYLSISFLSCCHSLEKRSWLSEWINLNLLYGQLHLAFIIFSF